jgi:uncharacterized membrane protein
VIDQLLSWEREKEMERHSDQGQYGDYAGSQPSYEYHQYEQQHTSERREYPSTGGFERSSYGRQWQEVQAAPPLDYASFAAILCYALCWFTGLFFLIFEQRNRYVRFHALQSLIFFGGINMLDIALLSVVRHHVPLLTAFAILSFLFVNFFAFVCWIIAMIHASRGTYFRLPFVGWFVARCINRGAALK